ncbi:MAG: hypothetical protein ACFFFH_12130 [Candidatus Thorarchaeota archaeon]
MLSRLREYLEIHKPNKYTLMKTIPLIFFLTLFVLRISLGIADPTNPPPKP